MCSLHLYHYTKLFSHHKTQLPILLSSYQNAHLLSVSYSSTSSPVNDVQLSEALTPNGKWDEKKSYTVSYLMNSLGFTQEMAVSISARISFEGSVKPNSVLALFEKYGFTRTQIADVVRRYPGCLARNENTIVPKLEFFLSKGMSKDVLASFIASDPLCLRSSLQNIIVPNYHLLKSILLTDDKVMLAMKRSPWLCYEDTEKCLAPNVKVLRELNVRESSIGRLLIIYPEVLSTTRNKLFEESISKVLGLGFDPMKSTLIYALIAVSGPSKVTFDLCYESYLSWGWSEEDIYTAFRKFPHCMIMSQNKINKVLDFLVNEIGLDTKSIVQTPAVMGFSLEKRTRPRLSVINALSSRGLLHKQPKLSYVMQLNERSFLDKFVVPYEKEVPDLCNFYKGHIESVET